MSAINGTYMKAKRCRDWDYPIMAAALTVTILLSGSAAAQTAKEASTPVTPIAPAPLVLVKDGQAQAAVITRDKPIRMETYAAEELVKHVKRATGVELSIVKEAAIPKGISHRIFVGDTKAAHQVGIQVDDLDFDVSVLRTVGSDFYIVGKGVPVEFWGKKEYAIEKYDNPLAVSGREPESWTPHPTGSGTLFGVYEFLERNLGVRWLWPGELGTYVPRAAMIEVPQADLITEAGLSVRIFGWSGKESKLGKAKPGSFSNEKTWTDFRDNQRVYERRHRSGISAPTPKPWHFFKWWWTYFGEDHPEWFVMDANGKRGEWDEKCKERKANMPKKENQSIGMHRPICVSNPDLPRFIVENDWDAVWDKRIPGPWMSEYHRKTFGKVYIDLSECDRADICHCSACKALDPPQPKKQDLSKYWGCQSHTDRYVTFWKRVYDLAVKRNPDIKIVTLLYWQTFRAPQGDVKLNKNFIGLFTPWTGRMMYMPMPEKSLEEMKRQWQGWKRTGMTLYLRPNYHHGSLSMPFFSIRQAGEFIKYTAREGSEGCYFDSLCGHYGVQALPIYMHFRLMANPDLEIDDIQAEFCSGFGPAAEAVSRYFDYWEKYSSQIVNGSERFPVWGGRYYNLVARLYTPKVFKPAEAILSEAMKAARKSANPGYAARVEFLQKGLKHARLIAHLMTTLQWNGKKLEPPLTDRAKFKASQKAYDSLLAFRRANEHLPIADLRSAFRMSWLGDLASLSKDFDDVKQVAPQVAPTPFSEWRFRKDPDNRGIQEKWFRTDTDLADWKAIKVPAFWEDSIGGYLGYGWYRTTFTVPEKWRGERLALDFGAVDEQAWVYVNGSLAGEHTAKSTGMEAGKLWDKPFSIPIDPALIHYGKENTLVVRVHNYLAAGGIHKPVVGHAPHPEQWRPLPAK